MRVHISWVPFCNFFYNPARVKDPSKASPASKMGAVPLIPDDTEKRKDEPLAVGSGRG